MRATYHPTVEDMTNDSRWQKLSCREGGKFDYLKAVAAMKVTAAKAAAAAVIAIKEA